MNKKIILLIAIIILLIIVAGYCFYQYSQRIQKQNEFTVCTMDAKICPDGSYVGRSGPKCEFSECPATYVNGIIYQDNEYGFELTLPQSWSNYYVVNGEWKGLGLGVVNFDEKNKEDTFSGAEYSGLLITIKNPKTTAVQPYQDIPIMIFNKDIWNMVVNEEISVSAAPVPPQKIGEGLQYVFATPPRWYGFTDYMGSDEALEIIKTFKTKTKNMLENISKSRIKPKEVLPLTYKELKFSPSYKTVENTDGTIIGNGAITAFNIKTGEIVWNKTIYSIKYDNNLEIDIQSVFISKMTIKDDKLEVVNEQNKMWKLNPLTGDILNENIK